MTGMRRRRLIVAGVAVLAFMLLVVLPGYLALQPAFFGRYPALATKHEPWSTSTHAEVGCQACHVRPTTIAQGVYRARMVGEFYLSFASRSREPNLFGKPTNDACLSCHFDLRTVSPSGDLRIPHRAHVSILKMQCVECHNYLVHEKNPAGKHTPRMDDCLRCHNGDTAENACTACHTEKAAPKTHRTKDWLVLHPRDAAEPGAECTDCHKFTDKWCVDCHTRRPQSHAKDWRAIHGLRIAKHRNCEACHAAPFCVRCHGEVPNLNLNPALRIVQ